MARGDQPHRSGLPPWPSRGPPHPAEPECSCPGFADSSHSPCSIEPTRVSVDATTRLVDGTAGAEPDPAADLERSRTQADHDDLRSE